MASRSEAVAELRGLVAGMKEELEHLREEVSKAVVPKVGSSEPAQPFVEVIDLPGIDCVGDLDTGVTAGKGGVQGIDGVRDKFVDVMDDLCAVLQEACAFEQRAKEEKHGVSEECGYLYASTTDDKLGLVMDIVESRPCCFIGWFAGCCQAVARARADVCSQCLSRYCKGSCGEGCDAGVAFLTDLAQQHWAEEGIDASITRS